MDRRRIGWLMGGLALVLAVAGCDEDDLVAVRIHLKDDGSGTIVTTALANPASPGVLEQGTRGVQWQDRLSVVAASGAFDAIGKLAVDDLAFASSAPTEGTHSLEVTIPCGAEAKWLRSMVPVSSDERKRYAPMFDPTGNLKTIAAKVKLVIDLPVAPTAHGVLPIITGTKEEVEDNQATLLVPVDAALAGTRPMTWQLTWRK